MPLQFDRQYSLKIGDYNTGKGKEFTQHQITFDVSKAANNKENSNSASLEITNLSRSELKEFETNFLAISLDIGYRGRGGIEGVPLTRLFSGQVVQMTTRRSGTDVVTQLILGSGYTDLNFSTISKTVPAGTKVQDVYDEIIKSVPGLSKGVFTGTNLNNPVIHGYPLSGSARQALNRIADANDMEWHEDNGIIYVNDKAGALNTKARAFVLNQGTGLIDTPYFIIGGREVKHTAKTNESLKNPSSKSFQESKKAPFSRSGLYFTALANPNITPGSLIKIESDDVNGFYKIDSVRFHGDYRGNDWTVDGFCNLLPELEEDNNNETA